MPGRLDGDDGWRVDRKSKEEGEEVFYKKLADRAKGVFRAIFELMQLDFPLEGSALTTTLMGVLVLTTRAAEPLLGGIVGLAFASGRQNLNRGVFC